MRVEWRDRTEATVGVRRAAVDWRNAIRAEVVATIVTTCAESGDTVKVMTMTTNSGGEDQSVDIKSRYCELQWLSVWLQLHSSVPNLPFPASSKAQASQKGSISNLD